MKTAQELCQIADDAERLRFEYELAQVFEYLETVAKSGKKALVVSQVMSSGYVVRYTWFPYLYLNSRFFTEHSAAATIHGSAQIQDRLRAAGFKVTITSSQHSHLSAPTAMKPVYTEVVVGWPWNRRKEKQIVSYSPQPTEVMLEKLTMRTDFCCGQEDQNA